MKRIGYRLLAVLAISAIILLSLVSCGVSSAEKSPSKDVNSSAGYDKAPESSAGGDYSSGDYVEDDVISDERKIIKTVNLTVQTKRYDDYLGALSSRLGELSGYVSSANYSDSSYDRDGGRSAYLTLRIPAEHLDDFLNSFDEYATVIRRNETQADVTLQYIDIDSRITVLRAEEAALTAMLAKADTIENMLLIRKNLNDVQGELASLVAQKNSLESRIAYSTVYINISEVEQIAQSDDAGFGEKVGNSFNSSLTGLGEGFAAFGIWLFGNSPYILFFGAIFCALFFAVRYFIRRRKRADKGRERSEGADSKEGEE